MIGWILGFIICCVITMALTQENVLKFLVEQGGKAKNSDLLNAFKCILNSCDVTEKKHKRELFKMFVNNVAVVKEIEGMKYIVIKKKYQHLLKGDIAPQKSKLGESSDCWKTFSRLDFRGCSHREVGETLHSDLDNNNISIVSSTSDDRLNSNSFNSPTELPLPRQLCPLEHKTSAVFAVVAVKSQANAQGAELLRRQDGSYFKILNQGTVESTMKPYMLPLRMPPIQLNTEVPVADCREMYMGKVASEVDPYRSLRTKKREVEECAAPGSPQMRRGYRSTKPGDQPKYSETIPLDRAEHEWLVNLAAGHWTQVYGLLLKDSQLSEKKDFISGFTALHWAAKSGKSEMVCKIIKISKRAGVHIDVNRKTHGGYTPLHIAAIHGQECVMTLLVCDYGADTNIRDNSGKKPYHYLLKGASPELRKMLGEPWVLQESNAERNEDYHFPEVQRGFDSLSRLLHPYVGHKKKHKRPLFSSIREYHLWKEDENEENTFRPRPLSDMFL
ncbi:ankyrin repeat domain-containing protein SOWAHA-like [Anguilla anguilla]|uniref:ankyrin repeat domain-containing protein SOWAHA-like n=1 Tax=Anguilla anguilla TaxID=7936 RepID=UPI0015ABB381|nr:ankyrin repeat domain-containing protein SOWAHA-like [Anguilla anguilla]